MRRKVTFGLTLTAVAALGTLAAFAQVDPFVSPHPIMGPRFHQWMVARRDVGTGGPMQKPDTPTKPIPVSEARVGSGPGLLGNEGHGSTPVASSTPQGRLESRLKSLALELR